MNETLLTVKLRNGGSRTGVVIRAETKTSVRGCTVRGGAFMTSQFCSCWFSGRQIEEIPRIGGVTEVAVEPPLVEGIVDKGCHRSIIVGEGLERGVESPHGRCKYCYS